jgi:hypothetical protein
MRLFQTSTECFSVLSEGKLISAVADEIWCSSSFAFRRLLAKNSVAAVRPTTQRYHSDWLHATQQSDLEMCGPQPIRKYLLNAAELLEMALEL